MATPEEIEEWVRISCEKQGVPFKVTDPKVIRRIAILLVVEDAIERANGDGRRTGKRRRNPD